MRGNHKYVAVNTFDKKTSKALNQFWAGYIIYITCYMLMISGVVSPKITYLQLLGLVIFMIPTFRLIKFRIENTYLRFIYIIYCGWLIYVVTRGFMFTKDYLFSTFVEAYGGIFLYFAPLILLFPQRSYLFEKSN